MLINSAQIQKSYFFSANWLVAWKTLKIYSTKNKNIKNIAIASPKSPILFTMKAFMAALFAFSFYAKAY